AERAPITMRARPWRILCHSSWRSPEERWLWRTATRVGEARSEEHTSELQSLTNLVCRLLLEKKKNKVVPHPLVVLHPDEGDDAADAALGSREPGDDPGPLSAKQQQTRPARQNHATPQTHAVLPYY